MRDRMDYIYKRHADDPRIPDAEEWRVAVWPDGKARACWPGTSAISGLGYAEALSCYEVAVEFINEVWTDNQ
jgi:hypothetical protein